MFGWCCHCCSLWERTFSFGAPRGSCLPACLKMKRTRNIELHIQHPFPFNQLLATQGLICTHAPAHKTKDHF
uniref:Uncharacterized protein n=1 Tax=Oryza brachyantha TaxID=4533 RepID=J3M0E5_ORYBR